MSFFNSILNKLGFGHDDKTVAQAPASAQAANATAPAAPAGPSAPASAAPAPGAAAAVSAVDVTAKLDALAAKNPQKLNWKTSIVDLLKLLELDSSLDARKTLARELGCPEAKMGDSAQMNMWLHKAVLQKLAANGGNVPPELL